MTTIFKLSGQLTDEERAAGVMPLAGRKNLCGLDFLHQDEEWVDADGRVWRLEEMQPRHRGNVLKLLRRNARSLAWNDGMAMITSPLHPQGEMACDAFQQALNEQLAEPDAWLAQTPLMRRLAELVAADQVAADPMATGWWE